MEKIELEILKFSIEDVIATSGTTPDDAWDVDGNDDNYF